MLFRGNNGRAKLPHLYAVDSLPVMCVPSVGASATS